MDFKTYDPLPKEWLPDYDAFIDEHLPDFPSLVGVINGDRYDIVDGDGNTLTFKEFTRRIANAESGFDCSNVYSETKIDDDDGNQEIDEVTGKLLTSNGLMQISQQDAEVEFHKGDLRALACKACESNLIFQPLYNLYCYMAILNVWADRKPDETLSQFGGRYWSSIRDGKYA